MKNIFSFFTLLILFSACGVHSRSEKFDPIKWKSDDKLRYTMVNELINNKLLIGKTRAEVIALLGKDIEEGSCTNCIGYSTYAPDQGFSIDHEVIEIFFDKENKVISVSLNAW